MNNTLLNQNSLDWLRNLPGKLLKLISVCYASLVSWFIKFLQVGWWSRCLVLGSFLCTGSVCISLEFNSHLSCCRVRNLFTRKGTKAPKFSLHTLLENEMKVYCSMLFSGFISVPWIRCPKEIPLYQYWLKFLDYFITVGHSHHWYTSAGVVIISFFLGIIRFTSSFATSAKSIRAGYLSNDVYNN